MSDWDCPICGNDPEDCFCTDALIVLDESQEVDADD